jgi:hypothetical protein
LLFKFFSPLNKPKKQQLFEHIDNNTIHDQAALDLEEKIKRRVPEFSAEILSKLLKQKETSLATSFKYFFY